MPKTLEEILLANKELLEQHPDIKSWQQLHSFIINQRLQNKGE